jgi:hypothetical protein
LLTGLICWGDELVCLVFDFVSLKTLLCCRVSSNIRISIQARCEGVCKEVVMRGMRKENHVFHEDGRFLGGRDEIYRNIQTTRLWPG